MRKIIPCLEYQLQLNQVDLSPGVLYPLSQKWVLGSFLHSFVYTRLSDKPGTFAGGLSVLGRYQLPHHLFAQAEYSWFSIPIRQNLDLSYYRGLKADLLLGCGYRQAINHRLSGQLSLLVNTLHNSFSPYGSRLFFRAGLNWRP